MPRYEFECNQCNGKFEISLSMKDKEFARIVCPKCKSEDTKQVYSGININLRSSAISGSNGSCGGSGLLRIG